MTENRNETVNKPLSSLPTCRMCYFIQACTLSNSLLQQTLCVSSQVLRRNLEGVPPIRHCGCVLTPLPPWALAISSAPGSLPAIPLTPACLLKHPGKFSQNLLTEVSQAPHNYHASTKTEEREAFFFGCLSWLHL